MTHSPLVPLSMARDPHVHGRKAATLAQLRAAGFPVPDGLVLPCTSTDTTIARAFDPILDWARPRAPYGLIVRSSATKEDEPTASYAGIYTSRFTPAHPEALIAAIRHVRTSARSQVARAYADAHETGEADMAILLQPALRPYASGALAAELRQHRLHRWRIEAVHGLAEPLLDGRQIGEIRADDDNSQRRLTRPTQQETITLPAQDEEMLTPPGEWISIPTPTGATMKAKLKTSAAGLVYLYHPDGSRARSVLTAQQQQELLNLAEAVSNTLTLAHIEIEWALSPHGELHLLQARSLTAPIPSRDPLAAGADTWQGIPAAPGVARGPMVHLDKPRADRATLNGAIIACDDLGPAATHALLAAPAAIIATRGGTLSHAAIVARELGIPCVTAVASSVADIPTGTIVHVDGATGTIRLTA